MLNGGTIVQSGPQADCRRGESDWLRRLGRVTYYFGWVVGTEKIRKGVYGVPLTRSRISGRRSGQTLRIAESSLVDSVG